MVSVGSLGGVLSTWSYLPTDSPKFHIGHSINLSLMLFAFVLTSLGLAHCRYENYMRRHGKRDYRIEGLTPEQEHALGHRHPSFKYME